MKLSTLGSLIASVVAVIALTSSGSAVAHPGNPHSQPAHGGSHDGIWSDANGCVISGVHFIGVGSFAGAASNLVSMPDPQLCVVAEARLKYELPNGVRMFTGWASNNVSAQTVSQNVFSRHRYRGLSNVGPRRELH